MPAMNIHNSSKKSSFSLNAFSGSLNLLNHVMRFPDLRRGGVSELKSRGGVGGESAIINVARILRNGLIALHSFCSTYMRDCTYTTANHHSSVANAQECALHQYCVLCVTRCELTKCCAKSVRLCNTTELVAIQYLNAWLAVGNFHIEHFPWRVEKNYPIEIS